MGETPRQNENELSFKIDHLAEGIRPIIACIGSIEQYGGEMAEIETIIHTGEKVDFYENPGNLEKRKFKNGGDQTYVISTIDEKPKYTNELLDCTSLVAVGRKADSEVQISFLTHQNPNAFFGKTKELFIKHLKEQLQLLKEKCLDKSIDVAIVGGKLTEDDVFEYQRSLEVLGSVVEAVLGFDPTVVSGPKFRMQDNVFLDTANRRLYVERPPGRSSSYDATFKVKNVEKMKEKWQKKNPYEK